MGNEASKQNKNEFDTSYPSLKYDDTYTSKTSTTNDTPLPGFMPQKSTRVTKAAIAQWANKDVQNGITGTFVSTRICAIIYTFWINNMSALMQQQKLEIGCAIFFGMIAMDKPAKKLLYAHANTDPHKIELLSVRFLDMLGWIIRSLMDSNIDLYTALKKLGSFHQNIGVKYSHFSAMLQSMHEAFSFYFERGYTFEVKYAMDEVFILISSIMMGQDTNNSHLTDITNVLHEDKIPFLQSLSACLDTAVGFEYFIRYLQQTWCDEIALWLKSMNKFKKAMNEKQRFIIARNIVKVSIKSSSTFAINISYNARADILSGMAVMEQRFSAKEKLEIKTDFFEKIEREMTDLIEKNHWVNFKTNMNKLKAACSVNTLCNPVLDDI